MDSDEFRDKIWTLLVNLAWVYGICTVFGIIFLLIMFFM